ncbi:hypothetical protein ACPCAJ_30860, partial [Streptomyces griseoincarnatus]
MGARVEFEGRTWQVSGLVGGRVYLAADDGATGCVLAAALVTAGPVPEWWTPLSPAPAGAGEEGSLMVMKVYSPEF